MKMKHILDLHLKPLFKAGLQLTLLTSFILSDCKVFAYAELGRGGGGGVDFTGQDIPDDELDDGYGRGIDGGGGRGYWRGNLGRVLNDPFAEDLCGRNKHQYSMFCVGWVAHKAAAAIDPVPDCGGKVSQPLLMCIFNRENIHSTDDYRPQTGKNGAGLAQMTTAGIETVKRGIREFGLARAWEEFIYSMHREGDPMVTGVFSQNSSQGRWVAGKDRDASIMMAALHLCAEAKANPNWNEKELARHYNGNVKTNKQGIRVMDDYAAEVDTCVNDSVRGNRDVDGHMSRSDRILRRSEYENDGFGGLDAGFGGGYGRGRDRFRGGRFDGPDPFYDPNWDMDVDHNLRCMSDGTVQGKNYDIGESDVPDFDTSSGIDAYERMYGYGSGRRSRRMRRNGRNSRTGGVSELAEMYCSAITGKGNYGGAGGRRGYRKSGMYRAFSRRMDRSSRFSDMGDNSDQQNLMMVKILDQLSRRGIGATQLTDGQVAAPQQAPAQGQVQYVPVASQGSGAVSSSQDQQLYMKNQQGQLVPINVSDLAVAGGGASQSAPANISGTGTSGMSQATSNDNGLLGSLFSGGGTQREKSRQKREQQQELQLSQNGGQRVLPEKVKVDSSSSEED